MANFISQVFIRIDGQDVSEEITDSMRELIVDTSLYLPSMFTIELHDAYLEWTDSELFEIGNRVEIAAKTTISDGQDVEAVLIDGEITALEPDFSSKGTTGVIVRGYTKAHRLHHGKRTRTFLRQSDSDIVRKIAGEVGLSAEVDDPGVTYDYVTQSNQTNMEFLQARAKRTGYQVYVDEEKLFFKKGEAWVDDGPELKLGQTLRHFRPRMTSIRQADKIKVQAWDPLKKEAIMTEVAPNGRLNQGGMSQTGGDLSSRAFGGAEAVLVDSPVSTVDEAKALAQGLADDLSGQFIQAEGACEGDPRIRARHTITVANVGNRFSGKYFVTSATHIFNEAGYVTEFAINGRQPNTITNLLQDPNPDEANGLVRGVVVGVVTNLNDPENLGRIKVAYPWLGDNIESDWLRMAAPSAGKKRGIFFLPEVNDEVLLAFEHGNIHRPYMIGALWNKKDTSPEPTGKPVAGGEVTKRIIQSRSGHIIVLDDTSGSEQIIIRDKTGSNEVVIDSTSNSMSLKVAQNLTIEANGNIELKATGDVSIQGMNLKMEGQVQSELKGTQVSVNGSAKVDVKGGMINLN